jgi:outer membrane protein
MARLPQKLACVLCLGFVIITGSGETLPPLTLREAHEVALKNHPRISVAQLTALASRQTVRQVTAGYLPQVSAAMPSVGTAGNNTRLAGLPALNNPSIFNRNAEGLYVTQLITDFGRTANLNQSAKFRAEAAEDAAQATQQQILLAVDGAFYSALQAQSVTRVAQITVTNRQVLLDQVTALASNKLRSDLDVSFAAVNLEDAQLLLSRAQNDVQAAFVQLANLMGLAAPTPYHRLVEQPLPPLASTNLADYVQQALRERPDALSLRAEQQAALKLARAERALRFPTVSAIGSAGVVPIHDPELSDTYAAAGLIVSLPLYTGGAISARQQEAALRAQAAAQSLRDLENNITRDVHIAWLNAQNALDRLHISDRLLANARQSFTLAQARYQNGISSIVELNQAELNEISAQITYANTQYEYRLQRSVLSFQTGSMR